MTNLENYDEAYAEVLEVLKYISLEDYNKIPKQYIEFMEENCDENCSFVYNIALPFEKQEISNKAKDILGMIFRLFIISTEQKKELNAKDVEIKKQKELEKKIKYNTDNLFKKEHIKSNDGNSVNTEKHGTTLIKKEESIFIKIWNKIKNIFRRK